MNYYDMEANRSRMAQQHFIPESQTNSTDISTISAGLTLTSSSDKNDTSLTATVSTKTADTHKSSKVLFKFFTVTRHD